MNLKNKVLNLTEVSKFKIHLVRLVDSLLLQQNTIVDKFLAFVSLLCCTTNCEFRQRYFSSKYELPNSMNSILSSWKISSNLRLSPLQARDAASIRLGVM